MRTARKYCIVPCCTATSKRNPEKLFFQVPRDQKTRFKWCKIVRRNKILWTGPAYICEDHFEVENDVEGWMRYRLLKELGKKTFQLSLKQNVVPHKFDCQFGQKPSNFSTSKRTSLASKKEEIKRKEQMKDPLEVGPSNEASKSSFMS
ncbi:hypothetical protein WDU94_011916 [Cyamophila willieti]